MANKLYEEANIQAIADAIRRKNGLSATYTVAQMADAILAISGDAVGSGGGASGGRTLFPPADGWKESKLTSSSGYSLGSCSFSEAGFTGSASTGQCAGMISPLTDLSGKNTLRIEFSASIPSGKGQFCVYVGPNQNSSDNVVDKVASSEEIAAGAMDIDVSAVSGEYYLMAGVMVWGGGATANCTITKITLDGGDPEDSGGESGGNAGTDTSDATATENHILYPETAYVKGKKVTGAIQSKSAQTYTPGTADQVIAAGQYLSGAQTIKGDANLVAGNIKSGVSIFGIAGSYAGSAASGGSAQQATGTFYGNGTNDVSFDVDFEPDLICVCVSDMTAMQDSVHIAGVIIVRDLFAQCAYRRASTTTFTNGSFGYDVTGLVRSTALKASYGSGLCTVHAVQGSYKFISSCEYTWTAIKF